uniref:C2H2-type domain-containing protein n=1 Tax=Nothobranchius furzeri TaxID=105023 RepID=A0A8C6M5U0_NOTFU
MKFLGQYRYSISISLLWQITNICRYRYTDINASKIIRFCIESKLLELNLHYYVHTPHILMLLRLLQSLSHDKTNIHHPPPSEPDKQMETRWKKFWLLISVSLYFTSHVSLFPGGVQQVVHVTEEKLLFSKCHQQHDVPTSSSTVQMTAETVRNPDLNTHERTSDSSETEVSGEDGDLGSELSDPGSETGDGDNGRKESRSSGSNKCVRAKQHVDSCREVQSETKLFSCDDCGKIFSDKSSLNRHTRVHTGLKPFACEICGQRFSQKTHLNRHATVHTGQKPFSCDLCEQRFSQKTYLNVHMRLHTGQKPFVCEFCGQRFSQNTYLNRHMRVHTGQKPFVCELCGQRFSHRTHLNCHMRVHTGQNPMCDPMCKHRSWSCVCVSLSSFAART